MKDFERVWTKRDRAGIKARVCPDLYRSFRPWEPRGPAGIHVVPRSQPKQTGLSEDTGFPIFGWAVGCQQRKKNSSCRRTQQTWPRTVLPGGSQQWGGEEHQKRGCGSQFCRLNQSSPDWSCLHEGDSLIMLGTHGHVFEHLC